MQVLNEISKKTYQEVISNMPDKPLPFDDKLFGGSGIKRIVIPYKNDEIDDLYEDLKNIGYEVDKEKNSILKTTKTNQGDKKVPIKINKFLNKEIHDFSKKIPQRIKEKIEEFIQSDTGNNYFRIDRIINKLKHFDDDFDLENISLEEITKYLELRFIVSSLEDTQQNSLSIVVSRAPIDVIRMSDFQNIQSCHSEGGSYWKCAIQETKTGGAVAFTVKTSDLSKVNLQDEEIFYDPDRGIPGIKPLSRIRLRRFENKVDGYSLAIPEIRMYGSKDNSFLTSLTKWSYKSQSERFYGQLPEMNEFVLTGGSYRDNMSSELFNNFFNASQYSGDVDSEEGEDGEDLYNQYYEECQGFLDRFNIKSINCHAGFEVDYTDDDPQNGVYISTWSGIKIIINEKHYSELKEIFKDWTEESKLKKLLNSETNLNIGQIDITNDSVNIVFDSTNQNHPDDFSSYLDDLLMEEKKYVNFYKIIISFINSSKEIEEQYNLFSVIDEIEEGEFENFEDVEYDESTIEINFNSQTVNLPQSYELLYNSKHSINGVYHNIKDEKENIGNVLANKFQKMLQPSIVRQLFIPGLEYSEESNNSISYSNSFYYSFQKSSSSDKAMFINFGLKFNIATEGFELLEQEEAKKLFMFFKYLNDNYESIINLIVSTVVHELNSKKLIVFK